MGEERDIIERIDDELNAVDSSRPGWDEYTYDLVEEARDEIQRLRHEDEANGDAINEVRIHLARVGIEATFVDDAAAIAAREIEKLRAEVARLELLIPEHDAGCVQTWGSGEEADAFGCTCGSGDDDTDEDWDGITIPAFLIEDEETDA